MEDSVADSLKVVSTWATLVDGFNTSALDFYNRVEQGVTKRQLPNVKFLRKKLSEGGVFSANREYLLVRSKNLTFAVCSSPYGTGHFFSWWLLEEEPFLESIPVIGFFYRLLFSRVTYYVADTTAMFKLSIQQSVREAIDEVTSAQGRRLLPDELTPAA